MRMRLQTHPHTALMEWARKHRLQWADLQEPHAIGTVDYHLMEAEIVHWDAMIKALQQRGN